MEVSEIESYARQLFDELGPRSIAVAARRAAEAKDSGDEAEEEKWRRIEQALMNLRGPHQG
jgi:hypothetical protein